LIPFLIGVGIGIVSHLVIAYGLLLNKSRCPVLVPPRREFGATGDYEYDYDYDYEKERKKGEEFCLTGEGGDRYIKLLHIIWIIYHKKGMENDGG
jgi:hypothetical protein